MALQKITRASITVYSFDGLKEAASMYTRNPTLDVLVGKFICEFPITPEQRRYLNKSVRKRLTVEVPQ